jgi:glycolate oxidase FAD binding subunit
MTAVTPRDVAELQDAVRAHDAIAIRAGGTKSAVAADAGGAVIDLRALSGITEYTPDECVFTARAGTPLRDIAATLAAHRQYLPFDPPLVEAGATIGGTVAAGVSGAGRYRYGGVRDFIIGARLVDGEGTLVRSGGKVVKNAAGFLLHHAVVGSAGRLGVLTDLTFKVFPAPDAQATLRLACGSADAAWHTARALEAARFDLAAVDFDAAGTMWIRVAGRQEGLQRRLDRLRVALAHACEVLRDDADAQVWAEAREWRWAAATDSIVKVPLARPLGLGASVRYSCAGAVAWVAWPGAIDALAASLSEAGVCGAVIRGACAGARIGRVAPNIFEARVRGVLDPRNRFRAASDSPR